MPSPGADGLSQQRAHELCAAVAGWQAGIVAEWVEAARGTAAGRLPEELLVDHVPALLDRFAHLLPPLAGGGAAPETLEPAAEYALGRLTEAVEIEDVLAEIEHLRAIVTRRWLDERGARGEPEELVLLGRGLDLLTRQIVGAHTRLQEHTLKARDRITAIPIDAADLDETLGRLLATIVEALTGIDTAAIFLLENDRLVLKAVAGLREEEVGRFSLSLGEGFAGRVAQERKAHFTPSISRDPLVQSPALRAHGVQGLYGVPLVARGALLGVATAGSLTEHTFSKLTVQLFGALAERAADVIAFQLARAERALLHKLVDDERRRLATILETLPAGVAIAGPNGETVEINQHMRRIWGGSAPEMGGIADYGRYRGYRVADGQPLAPEDWPLARALLHGETTLGEAVDVLRFDSTCGTLLASAAPLRASTGRLVGAVSIMLDLTEQRRLAVLLERETAELNAIVDSFPEGFVIYGPSAEIRRMSATAQWLLQYPHEVWSLSQEERFAHLDLTTLEGKPFPPERGPARRALAGEVIRGEQLVITRPDGERVWVSMSAAPVVLPSGERVGAVAGFVDVSSLHRMREHLQDIVRMLSHDLRTPLSVILMQARLMTQTASAPGTGTGSGTGTGTGTDPRVARIETSAKRMAAMLQDLVDLARIETGQFQLNLAPVDLRAFIDELTTRLNASLPKGRITPELPPSLPPIRADPDRLERIVSNLLSNALKYSPEDRPVMVRAEARGAEVLVSVTDFGRGIAQEDLPHIFERYYRAKDASKAAVEGLGLGLHITGLLVEAHGARITAESALGRGSTFTVAFAAA